MSGYGINTSCIKAIKSTYKGSKVTHKKGMNECLEAEKEAGIYKVAQESERGVETVEKYFARKSCQVVVKWAQSSSSEGGSSRKKA